MMPQALGNLMACVMALAVGVASAARMSANYQHGTATHRPGDSWELYDEDTGGGEFGGSRSPRPTGQDGDPRMRRVRRVRPVRGRRETPDDPADDYLRIRRHRDTCGDGPGDAHDRQELQLGQRRAGTRQRRGRDLQRVHGRPEAPTGRSNVQLDLTGVQSVSTVEAAAVTLPKLPASTEPLTAQAPLGSRRDAPPGGRARQRSAAASATRSLEGHSNELTTRQQHRSAGRGLGTWPGRGRPTSGRRCGRPPTSASWPGARPSARAWLRASTRSSTSSSGSPPSRWTSRRIVASGDRQQVHAAFELARLELRDQPDRAIEQPNEDEEARASRAAQPALVVGVRRRQPAAASAVSLEDRDDRVALADLASGDDAREPLPVVADREICHARRSAAADPARLRRRARRSPTPRRRQGPGSPPGARGRAPRGPRARSAARCGP